MITPEIVEQNFPKVVQWVIETEKAILEGGYRLSAEYRKDAEAIGVRQLDDVRILAVKKIPMPSDPGLSQLAIETGLILRAVGMTFGHGILLKKGAVDRRLVAHELVHVMQYERFGGIEAFLKEYVKEVVFDPGYPLGPLEKEAERLADRAVKNSSAIAKG
jgi:uncharacterized protein DUF4157